MAEVPQSLLSRLRTRFHPFIWVTLALGGISVVVLTYTTVLVVQHGAVVRDFGWTYRSSPEGTIVGAVRPDGPANGALQPGDRILALDGDTRVAPAALEILLDRISDGSEYRLRVEQGGKVVERTLRLGSDVDPRHIADAVGPLLSMLSLIGLGMVIGLVRPSVRYAQLSTVICLVATWLFGKLLLMQGYEPYLHGVGLGISFLGTLTWALPPVGGLHFFMLWPPGLPEDRFWSNAVRLSYLWAGFHVLQIATFGVAYAVSALVTMDALLSAPYLIEWQSIYQNFGAGVASLLLIALVIRDVRVASAPDQKRRLKWIAFGVAIATLPPIVDAVAFLVAPTGTPAGSVFAAIHPAQLLFVAAPVAFGYAILKHQVYDIRVVVRSGLRYLLTKNALRALVALPALALAYTAYSNPGMTIAEVVSHSSLSFYCLIAFALGLAFQGRLRNWVDRRFFREAYDREHLLLGLIEEIHDVDSVEHLSERVSRDLDAAIHPTRLFLYFRDKWGPDLTLVHSSGCDAEVRLTEGSALLELLERDRHARDFPFELAGLPEAERGALERAGIALVTPMTGSEGRLEGMLLLGPKKSEEPYSPADRELLEAVAAQIGLVCENARLKDRLAHDRRTRVEVLARIEGTGVKLLRECPRCGRCYDGGTERCADDDAEIELTLPVELVVGDKYRLERRLGRGGMGAVYEASDLRLGRRVAVKLLTSANLGDRAALKRFEREARASARLVHPNIVRVYDYGAVGAEGAFLVMELLAGETLRVELQRVGRLDPGRAAELMSQILDAVEAAHHVGVIHRDLKPENVLVMRTGTRETAKAVDFGLAKFAGAGVRDLSTMSELTVPGSVLGTAGYMAPEQMAGNDVDERADVLSLGVMAAELVTGERPFSGRTWIELANGMDRGEWHLHGSGAGADRFRGVLDRCLAARPDQRFASLGEMKGPLLDAMREYES